MVLISHRGNLDGSTDMENNPDYILTALKQFNCQIDVWYIDNKWVLGHDKPQYEIDLSFLQSDKLWCHAKTYDSLNEMLKNDIHCFYHEEDKFTLTSLNVIWQYPTKQLSKNTICVLPQQVNNTKEEVKNTCTGVCSDFIRRWK